MNARKWMERHIKKLVKGIDYNYVTQMKSSESADGVTISVEFSDPRGLGEFLGTKPIKP